MKITVVNSLCRISTTLIFERHVCPIGIISDAGKCQIFPQKKEMVTTQFSRIVSNPYKQKKNKQTKKTINTAGWVVIFLEKTSCLYI